MLKLVFNIQDGMNQYNTIVVQDGGLKNNDTSILGFNPMCIANARVQLTGMTSNAAWNVHVHAMSYDFTQ